jgi:hypothetical protein
MVDVKSIAQPTGGTAGTVTSGTSHTQFGTSTLQSGVHFKSAVNNTGTIFVGFNSQVASGIGFPLYNGDQIFIETDNLDNIFHASTVAGATLHFIGT